MSEIKSTMEKVMERLAAMDAVAGDREAGTDSSEEMIRQGMRQAAAYLRGEPVKLDLVLAEAGADQQAALRRGMFRTLARNIVLPREEEQLAPAEQAMNGLLELAGGSNELQGFLGAMKKILEQYLGHQGQLRQQLRDQFAQEIARLEGNMAAQGGAAPGITPEQHPKFQEEWQRIQDELSSQYGRALEQYKQQIQQFLGA